jgi:hypothetical protein
MGTKTKAKNTVAKALTPEERTLLENIAANIQQVLSIEGAEGSAQPGEGGEGAGEAAMASLMKEIAGGGKDEPEEDGEPEPVKKDEQEDGRKPAETRMEPVTDVNEKTLPMVAKLLTTLARRYQPATKSVDVQTSAITKAIGAALTPLVQKVEALEKFTENLMDSMGITEAVEKSMTAAKTSQQVTKSALPVQNVEQSAIVGELLSVIKDLAGVKKGEAKAPFSLVGDPVGMQDARKDLRAALPHIFRGAIAKAQEQRNRYAQ